MPESLNFGVDPKLAVLLGSSYNSTEKAIKELVDNAWDADASEVLITLPDQMSSDPIVVIDDGDGMTIPELRGDYLKVARDRTTIKGDRTKGKGRKVRGRKGIGKFAGLMVAERMQLITRARGTQAELLFQRESMAQSKFDFERVQIPLTESKCSPDVHGTTIILSDLNRKLTHPSADKLRSILLLDYGRSADFKILVNGQETTLKDIPGEYFDISHSLPEVGEVALSFAISEGKQKLRESGIVIKVDGKPIGDPSYFGLEDQEDLPKELLKRVYGEIEVGGLRDDVTADWGAVIENSIGLQAVHVYVGTEIRKALESSFEREFKALEARIRRQNDARLRELPEYKREYATSAISRVIKKFYGESEDRIQSVVAVVLDSLERDEYWEVLRAVHEAEHGDIQALADALTNFGLLEIVMIGKQAKRRISILDSFEKMINDASTLESQVHKVFENNTWILGVEHALLFSNKSLKTIVQEYTVKKYSGKRESKRPDLLLLSDLRREYTLIEFKRPAKSIGRDEEAQAQKYRDDLTPVVSPIRIMMMGKDVDTSLRLNSGKDIQYLSYAAVCSHARNEVEWILSSLAADKAL
jgi:Histidine kinase-, DNA gyrase B-, and HSP90-like ATPase